MGNGSTPLESFSVAPVLIFHGTTPKNQKKKKNIKYDRPTSTFHRFPTVPASQVGVADAVFDLLECHLHSVKFEHSGEELVICRLTYIYIINYIYIYIICLYYI